MLRGLDEGFLEFLKAVLGLQKIPCSRLENDSNNNQNDDFNSEFSVTDYLLFGEEF
jgi:hypothetical protein